ncbi:DNA/RNA non-specific endonuclease, partial [Bacteroides fragilis]|nr:DNA/RNA non-specific endonuclease [Bacteroides fragilis]
PKLGGYISQDPIRLAGNNPTLYGYTNNPNFIFDILGWIVIPTYTRGLQNEILTAKATITSSDLGTGTRTNKKSIAQVRGLGFDTDDAGHIIAKRLGGSGDVDNVFPQDSHINRGQFRAFEAKIADAVKTYSSVDVSIQLKYGKGGTRPTYIIYFIHDS